MSTASNRNAPHPAGRQHQRQSPQPLRQPGPLPEPLSLSLASMAPQPLPGLPGLPVSPWPISLSLFSLTPQPLPGLSGPPASMVVSLMHQPLWSLPAASNLLSTLQPEGSHQRDYAPSFSGPFCDSLLLQANVYFSKQGLQVQVQLPSPFFP